MIDKVNKSLLPTKKAGDILYHQEINSLNNTLNNGIDTLNTQLKTTINVNLEMGTPGTPYALQDAIKLIPQERRVPGIVVRYLDMTTGYYLEYTYQGKNTEDWEKMDMWTINGESVWIDGGEW